MSCSPSVKPYACGRERCWPAGADISSACFPTSKELLDHIRTEHTQDPAGHKPFRCALAGCGKSWKARHHVTFLFRCKVNIYKHCRVLTVFSITYNCAPISLNCGFYDLSIYQFDRPFPYCNVLKLFITRITCYKPSSCFRGQTRHGCRG
jgi:hypothetical protein